MDTGSRLTKQSQIPPRHIRHVSQNSSVLHQAGLEKLEAASDGQSELASRKFERINEQNADREGGGAVTFIPFLLRCQMCKPVM